MRKVAITFFELGVAKKIHAKISEYFSYCFFEKITNKRLFHFVQSYLIYFVSEFQK